jgi:hypothetical protein
VKSELDADFCSLFLPRFQGKVSHARGSRAQREVKSLSLVYADAFTCSAQQSLTLSHNLDTFLIYCCARCEQRAVMYARQHFPRASMALALASFWYQDRSGLRWASRVKKVGVTQQKTGHAEYFVF